MNYYVQKIGGHRSQLNSAQMNNRHPWQLKKSKSSGQVWSTANLAHLPQWAKGAELEVQFSCELQNGPQDFIFFNCHGCQTIILAEIHCYLSPPKVEKIIYS